MDRIYIQNLIKDLKKLEIMKEELNTDIKRHETLIKNYMQMNQLEEVYGLDGEKVIYTEIVSNRFDTKEFKKHFENLYNAYLKKTKNFRFKFSY